MNDFTEGAVPAFLVFSINISLKNKNRRFLLINILNFPFSVYFLAFNHSDDNLKKVDFFEIGLAVLSTI